MRPPIPPAFPEAPDEKPIVYLRSSYKDLADFPRNVQDVVFQALYEASLGLKSDAAKPLRGDPAFRGAKTLEVVEDYDRNTYRTVYTVKFAGVVYVLHAFQKKSKSGVATPLEEIRLVKSRLKDAEAHFAEQHKKRDAG